MVAIRTGVESDLVAVLELWSRVAAVTRVPSDEAALRRLLLRDPDALLVATIEGRVVATAISGWDGWRCHLYRVAVDVPHRRSGLAARLIDEVADRRAAAGVSRLDAMVHEGNDAGAAFWAGIGFERDEEDRRWTRRV